jgi:hypothetical protein
MDGLRPVPVAGRGIELPVAAVCDIRRTLARAADQYASSLLVEVAQTAACNAVHSVEERTARWLLQAADKAQTDELGITHEFLAMMLAVRRASVTVVVGVFARAGLITAKRGRVGLLDRAGLKEFACTCYEVIRSATETDVGRAAPRRQGGARSRLDSSPSAPRRETALH